MERLDGHRDGFEVVQAVLDGLPLHVRTRSAQLRRGVIQRGYELFRQAHGDLSHDDLSTNVAAMSTDVKWQRRQAQSNLTAPNQDRPARSAARPPGGLAYAKTRSNVWTSLLRTPPWQGSDVIPAHPVASTAGLR